MHYLCWRVSRLQTVPEMDIGPNGQVGGRALNRATLGDDIGKELVETQRRLSVVEFVLGGIENHRFAMICLLAKIIRELIQMRYLPHL